MKVLILAGGFGTRLAEETQIKPKPMAEIGTRPILWHIMRTYSYYGFNDFVILLGYKGYFIKDYFANYFLHHSDVTIDLANNSMEIHQCTAEPWKVTLLETGLHTGTAGRLKRAAHHIGDETFMFTYGDGVADINIHDLMNFHRNHGKMVTMTSVKPKGRFGAIETQEDLKVSTFKEKPEDHSNWINGGFFVCEPSVFQYIPDEAKNSGLMFETSPLETIAEDGELYTFRHTGFWQCMDTLADKNKLNAMWDAGDAKWQVPNTPLHHIA